MGLSFGSGVPKEPLACGYVLAIYTWAYGRCRLVSASKSSASHFNSFRFKFSSAYCPTASESEKQLLACKNFELSQRLKSADDTTKKTIAEEKKKMFAAAAAKGTEEKKTALAAHKAMFTKAYAMYCGNKASDEACSNELMKKLYSGEKQRKKMKKA